MNVEVLPTPDVVENCFYATFYEPLVPLLIKHFVLFVSAHDGSDIVSKKPISEQRNDVQRIDEILTFIQGNIFSVPSLDVKASSMVVKAKAKMAALIDKIKNFESLDPEDKLKLTFMMRKLSFGESDEDVRSLQLQRFSQILQLTPEQVKSIEIVLENDMATASPDSLGHNQLLMFEMLWKQKTRLYMLSHDNPTIENEPEFATLNQKLLQVLAKFLLLGDANQQRTLERELEMEWNAIFVYLRGSIFQMSNSTSYLLDHVMNHLKNETPLDLRIQIPDSTGGDCMLVNNSDPFDKVIVHDLTLETDEQEQKRKGSDFDYEGAYKRFGDNALFQIKRKPSDLQNHTLECPSYTVDISKLSTQLTDGKVVPFPKGVFTIKVSNEGSHTWSRSGLIE